MVSCAPSPTAVPPRWIRGYRSPGPCSSWAAARRRKPTSVRSAPSRRGTRGCATCWANAGVELCLGRTPGPVGQGREVTPLGPITQVPGDENEFRLLLSLRFRIRNDLGLPEDDYDRLLDNLR